MSIPTIPLMKAQKSGKENKSEMNFIPFRFKGGLGIYESCHYGVANRKWNDLFILLGIHFHILILEEVDDDDSKVNQKKRISC